MIYYLKVKQDIRNVRRKARNCSSLVAKPRNVCHTDNLEIVLHSLRSLKKEKKKREREREREREN